MSEMQRNLRREVDEVLRNNLHTRLARHRAKLAAAAASPKAAAPREEAAVPAPPEEAAVPVAPVVKPKVQMRDRPMQAGPGELDAAPAGSRHALHEAVLKAIASQRPMEERGFLMPSGQQKKNEIRTPYRGDDAFQDDGQSQKETLTLKHSLQNIDKLVEQRAKQIKSLSNQADYVKEHLAEDTEAARKARTSLESLERDPSQAAPLRLERLERRRKRVKELESQLAMVQEQKGTFFKLMRQQHTYLRQSERIQSVGGYPIVRRIKAGDIFLEPKPVPVQDCDTEPVQGIECSFANPYEVDSFPFEPNVLATKPAKNMERELALDELEEETAEDLADAAESPVNTLRTNLARQLDGSDSEDDAPPPQSARSF